MTEPRPIACPFCNRPFDTDNDLRQHLYMKRRVAASHQWIDGRYVTRDHISAIARNRMTLGEVLDLVQGG